MVRMEYMVLTDPEGICWSADVIERNGFAVDHVVLYEDGKEEILEESAFWKMLVFEPENPIANYIIKHREEFPLMLKGQHRKYNLCAIEVSSKGNLYFNFDDGVTANNVLEINGAYSPRISVKGLGNKYTELWFYDIKIIPLEPIREDIYQNVQIDEYFGDEHTQVIKTSVRGNETVMRITDIS